MCVFAQLRFYSGWWRLCEHLDVHSQNCDMSFIGSVIGVEHKMVLLLGIMAVCQVLVGQQILCLSVLVTWEIDRFCLHRLVFVPQELGCRACRCFRFDTLESRFVNSYVFVKKLGDFYQTWCKNKFVVERSAFGLGELERFGGPAKVSWNCGKPAFLLILRASKIKSL